VGGERAQPSRIREAAGTMQGDSSGDLLAGILTAGCLQPFLGDFPGDLTAGGYGVLSARDSVRAATHFGRWMGGQEIGVDQLTDRVVDRFAAHC
jgi:hypothetical protein